MRRAAVVLAAMLGLPAAAAAQGDCFPGPSSNEARTLAIFSVPLAFSPAGAPELLPGLRIGVEAASLPGVDRATATPTICRPGKGPENTDLLPVLPRPRLALPLPGGLALQVSWIPPVRVNGVRGNLFGLSVGKSFGRLDGMVLALRAHATFGSIRAPITCDDDALADASSECFGGERSDDRFRPNILGADLTVGFPVAHGRLRPYAGGGYNRLRPRFQVHFVNQFGKLDDRRVEVDLERLAAFGGATWAATPRLQMIGEVYAVPADAVTVRLVMRATIGP
ncbi:MAG: hypothetical protein ACJ8DC_06775 [Gemmatimonadales bacterium]